MTDYISREAAKMAACKLCEWYGSKFCSDNKCDDHPINALPAADVVPVVRCKDCKHYNDGWCYNPNTYDDEKTRGNTVPDWYCADGERRE